MYSGLISFLTCGLVQPNRKSRKHSSTTTSPSMQQRTGHDSPFARFDQRHQYAGPDVAVQVVKHARPQAARPSAQQIFPAAPIQYVNKATSPASFRASVKSSASSTSSTSGASSAKSSASCTSSTKSSASSVSHTSTQRVKSSPISAAASVASRTTQSSTVRSPASTAAATESYGRSTVSTTKLPYIAPLSPRAPSGTRFVQADGRLTREAILALNIPKTGQEPLPAGSMYECSSWNSDALSKGSYVPTVNSLDSLYCSYGLVRGDIRQYSQPCINKIWKPLGAK
ncbi:hypothetical protein BCR37DRAFT_385182 [Protomyces lactucae-debilis]|uniref:Uncharacterized protein n=1 Tax=Protomyces lactucae-debilis TaxID=2754530 RepID=A0A1Y2FWL5_PROLT|nr:uncharacterized protein BCR37DRAFT_385182 [Protomyces lactucae-debilis]ORY87927.1 hypothetical protein BCR37DRAFT_385182 [Protomyces lactucae-debilis]